MDKGAGVKVSVITVCMNAEKTIARTLDSVVSQTYDGPLEYIIKDGGSKDGTDRIVESFRDKFADKGIMFLDEE